MYIYVCVYLCIYIHLHVCPWLVHIPSKSWHTSGCLDRGLRWTLGIHHPQARQALLSAWHLESCRPPTLTTAMRISTPSRRFRSIPTVRPFGCPIFLKYAVTVWFWRCNDDITRTNCSITYCMSEQYYQVNLSSGHNYGTQVFWCANSFV